jgi:hypothetical protein
MAIHESITAAIIIVIIIFIHCSPPSVLLQLSYSCLSALFLSFQGCNAWHKACRMDGAESSLHMLHFLMKHKVVEGGGE